MKIEINEREKAILFNCLEFVSGFIIEASRKVSSCELSETQYDYEVFKYGCQDELLNLQKKLVKEE